MLMVLFSGRLMKQQFLDQGCTGRFAGHEIEGMISTGLPSGVIYCFWYTFRALACSNAVFPSSLLTV
jgi:hypothetical protein